MVQPTWITLPAGIFILGSDPRQAAPPFANERPQQRIALPTFHISRHPITNAQYRHFIEATAHPAPAYWRDNQPLDHTENFPVTYVTWHDAQAFCTWAGVRLPTEAEWEKAARAAPRPRPRSADEARWWPWGNHLPTSAQCHFNGQAQGIAPAAQSVMAVGQLPQGASPYGVQEMAGNVWEWTHSLYRPYPYRPHDGREEATTNGQRVVRGGSYNHDLRHIRCAARDGMAAGVRDVYIGFRVATSTLDIGPVADLDWGHRSRRSFLDGQRGRAQPIQRLAQRNAATSRRT